jgi:hypothetical protein
LREGKSRERRESEAAQRLQQGGNYLPGMTTLFNVVT